MWSPEYKKNISFHMGNTVITKVNFKLKTEQQSNGLRNKLLVMSNSGQQEEKPVKERF